MNYAQQNRQEKRERKEVLRKRVRAAFRHAYQQDPNSDFAAVKERVVAAEVTRREGIELREERNMFAASRRFFAKISKGKIKTAFGNQMRQVLKGMNGDASTV
jgi:hypothetical protein